MPQWSFEVRSGGLTNIPESLRRIAGAQSEKGIESFFVAEGGTLLNEPDEQITISIDRGAAPALAISRTAEAVAWLLDRLEAELDQDFQYNYLKVSFVNLLATRDEEIGSGVMTTNSPLLPEVGSVPAHTMVHQMTTALRMFFSHLGAAAITAERDAGVFACDWVTMTFNKA